MKETILVHKSTNNIFLQQHNKIHNYYLLEISIHSEPTTSTTSWFVYDKPLKVESIVQAVSNVAIQGRPGRLSRYSV